MALERWVVKLLCMIGLFVFMCTFVLLPIKVSKAVAKQGQRGLLIISVLSCFGGGVFFGAYLTHMNPEVRAVLEVALLEPHNITYPLPELLAGAGFFIILFLERLVQTCRDKSESKATKKSNDKFPKSKKEHTKDDVILTVARQTGDNRVTENSGNVHVHVPENPGNGHVAENTGNYNDSTEIPNIMINGHIWDITSNSEEHQSHHGNHHGTHHGSHHGGHGGHEGHGGHGGHGGHVGIKARPGYEDLVLPGTCCSQKSPEPDVISMTSKIVINVDTEGAQTRSIIFMIAMSLDCVFEGLALGLMHNSQDVVDLFVAIISHEFVMCFCIGLELVKYHKTKIVVAGGISYALTETFGIVVGMCISEIGAISADPTTVAIVTGVLQALAAGTFIYCAFLECPRTFTMKHDLGYHVNTHNEKVMCETWSATYYTRTGLCLHKMKICC